MGIGDWGLAQSPIPNPQSPIPILIFNFYFKLINNYLLIFININLFDIKMKYILIEFILL